jgi:hypothetical protein
VSHALLDYAVAWAEKKRSIEAQVEAVCFTWEMVVAQQRRQVIAFMFDMHTKAPAPQPT